MKPFAYEWARIKTVRSTWVLVILTLIAAVAIAFIAASVNVGSDDPTKNVNDNWVQIIRFAMTSFSWLFGALLGIFAFGHEYRYGTIRPTLSALPRRRALCTAKFVVPAVLAALMTLAGGLIAVGIAKLRVGDRLASMTADNFVRVFLMCILSTVLWTVIGAALTAITRSQIFAIVAVLVWPLIIETIVILVLSIDALESISGAAKYLPSQLGDAMTRSDRPQTFGDGEALESVSWLTGALSFTAIAVILAMIGAELFSRRDA